MANPILPDKSPDQYTLNDVFTIGAKAIDFLATMAGVVAVLAIIWGGILFITSGGDEEKAKNAKNWVVYAVIGIIVVLLAKVLVAQSLRLIEARCPTDTVPQEAAQTLRGACP